MNESIQIEHRRSARREAILMFINVAFTGIGLIAIFCIICINHPYFTWIIAVIFFTILAVVLGLCLAYAILNFQASEDFHCILTSERLICRCPTKMAGDSFELKIQEISVIEQKCGHKHVRHYLYDVKGNRYWLTTNYRNPVYKIFNSLESMNPNIQRRTIRQK